MAKVLAISSGGGHFVQLKRLIPAFQEHDVSYATTIAGYFDDSGKAVPTISDTNANTPLKLILCAHEIFFLLARIKPDFVVTTGAAPGLLAIILGRMFGAKTIWIDSIANGDKLSGSGRYARYFADVWLTQWEHLAHEQGPHFWGSVI